MFVIRCYYYLFYLLNCRYLELYGPTGIRKFVTTALGKAFKISLKRTLTNSCISQHSSLFSHIPPSAHLGTYIYVFFTSSLRTLPLSSGLQFIRDRDSSNPAAVPSGLGLMEGRPPPTGGIQTTTGWASLYAFFIC